MGNVANQSELAFDGPLSLGVGVAVFVGLSLFFFTMLWRERRVTGAGTALTFFSLRMVALAAIVWMLLAASSVTVDRQELTRSVVAAVDVSPSMQTRDPVKSLDRGRWHLAGDDTQSRSIAACDRAVVSAVFVRRQLASLLDSAAARRPGKVTYETLRRCSTALDRIEEHCAALALPEVGNVDIEQVQDRIAAAKDLVRPAVKGWNGTLDLAQLDRLIEAEPIVAGIEHQLRRAAAELARDADLPAAVVDTDTRVNRVVAVLDRLQSEAAADQAKLQRVLFDVRATPVGEDASLLDEVATAARQNSGGSEDSPISTDLGAAVRDLSPEAADKIAAVVMFTDAAHNETTVGDPWEVAESAGIPIHVVPIGSTERVRDIVLYSLVAPPVVMEGDEVVIEAHLRAHGCSGETVLVELHRDGEAVDYQHIELHADPTSRRVTFATKASKSGSIEFDVSVGGVAEEQTETNNHQKVSVEVTRRNIRVLLVDGVARWEFKYLRELFRRDDTIDCDELVFAPRVLGTGFREGDPQLPTSVEGWAEYDVAILGDIPPRYFPESALSSLEEFISKRDGTIVVIAGDRYMPAAYEESPLVDLIPTQRQPLGAEPEDGYRLVLTSSGRRHRALTIADGEMDTAQIWEFVSRSVPIYALSEYSRPKPAAHTLIRAVSTSDPRSQGAESTKAFLCWHPVGGGRVVYLSSPDSWRLRFRRGDGPHHRFWGQILRWSLARELSVGSELLQIRTERSHYDANEPVDVAVTLRSPTGDSIVGGAVAIMAESEDGSGDRQINLVADEDIPGRYSARFASLDVGSYTLTPVGSSVEELRESLAGRIPTADVTIRPPQHAELVATQCRLDIARRIAEASGGQVIPPTAVAEILALNEILIPSESSESRKPLWPQWKYFWAVFFCLTMEWGIRKWRGVAIGIRRRLFAV